MQTVEQIIMDKTEKKFVTIQLPWEGATVTCGLSSYEDFTKFGSFPQTVQLCQ